MTSAIIVAIVFGSVITIIRMCLNHEERIQRIKHGYPLDDGHGYSRGEAARPEDEYVDYRADRQQ